MEGKIDERRLCDNVCSKGKVCIYIGEKAAKEDNQSYIDERATQNQQAKYSSHSRVCYDFCRCDYIDFCTYYTTLSGLSRAQHFLDLVR